MTPNFVLSGGVDRGASTRPGSLRTHPRLSQWLRITADGWVEVTCGKVEIGQGILTALQQIAADELDVAFERVRMVPPRTGASPDEGVTSGSLSVQESGMALRYACAEARQIYLEHAAHKVGVDVATLEVEDGHILGPRNLRTSYWELADPPLLEREATGRAFPKPAAHRRLTGIAAERVDIPDKVFGKPRFIHDMMPAGLLHGRVLRPPSIGARLARLEEAETATMSGVVAVVRDGSLVGVIADTELLAARALERLRRAATWHEADTLPDEATLADWLKAQPADTTLITERTSKATTPVAQTLRREYFKPFVAHASIAPSCAIAQWRGDGVYVWTHSQSIYNLQADLALALALPRERIVVEHVEGAGCYGHNPADDAAFDAVLLARAVHGRPVRVQWERADELAWSPFGPAMAVSVEVDMCASGKIIGWRHDVWSNGHSLRPGRASSPTLLAASHLERPCPPFAAINMPPATGGGADRNAVPGYDLGALRVLSHRVLSMPIRSSALRSLGAFANVFAIEQTIDEVAAHYGQDPLAYRLSLLRDERAHAVLQAAAARASWAQRAKGEGTGYGIGFARYKNTGAYCAVVAEIEADREIRVRRLWAAVDVGEAINPDGVINQIEGGAIQATSWTLKEAVRFDRRRITSNAWESYPILRFCEVPIVDVELIVRPAEEPLGAGEAAHGPTAAAIANAVADALGVRVRTLPITPESIIGAIEQSA